MLRRFCMIILLMAIFWPFLSALTPMSVTKQTAELKHATLHLQGTDHHLDNQFLHIEDTGGTSKHLHADGELNAEGLLILGRSHVATIGSVAPHMDVKSIGPPADLEGPLRPPRLLS